MDNLVHTELEDSRKKLDILVGKYREDGTHYAVFKHLMMLRNISLAHRQSQPKEADDADSTDDEIETFYEDSLEIVRLILHIVLGRAFDLADFASIYKTYADFFWSGSRGENTPGHPRFRARPPNGDQKIEPNSPTFVI